MANFAIMGVAGYIAPRHLAAIKAVGGNLVAAVDPHDSVGILDSYGYDVSYFRETERFDRYLDKQYRKGDKIDYVSICTPNYLHDAHCRLALRNHADAICEKPLVLKLWNLDALEELEQEYGKRVYTIMQLRLNPTLIKLREDIQSNNAHHMVEVNYSTPRGIWYYHSWKGDLEKSGGILMNIGVHMFDMLLWIFGLPTPCRSLFYSTASTSNNCASGGLHLERATINWRLSIDPHSNSGRSMIIDNNYVSFTDNFTDLHTKSYEEILAGRGFGITDARPAIELVRKIQYGED